MLSHYIKIGFLAVLLLPLRSYSSNSLTFPLANAAHAPEVSLTVFDEYGKPLMGAMVYSQDNALLAQTSEDGSASVPAEIGSRVVIQHPGYYPQSILLKAGMQVALVSRYLQREDTISVLYDKKTIHNNLGSGSVVYNNQIKGTPTSLYLNALTGRIPGLYTQQVSGFRNARSSAITANDLAGSLPAEGTRYSASLSDNSELNFQLRGQQPVTIIDGVQREIYSIDPESIESVTIAKDALSSILLGQRSSRGVLQITTKKGTVGPPRISFTAQTGMQQSLKQPEPLDAYQYAYLYNEALLNSGRQPVYTQEDFNLYRDGSSPLLYPDVNWYDAVLKNSSPITKYNLGVNGGIRNARYALSLSYLAQDGMFKSVDDFDYSTNLEQRRYLINSSIDVDVTKDFTIGLQLFGRIQEGRQPGAGTSNILSGLYNTPNNAYPIRNDDGSYGGSSVFRTNLYQQTTGSGYLIDNTRDVFANLDFQYKFNQWLPGLYASGKVNVSSTSSSFTNRSRLQPVFDVRYNEAGQLIYVRYGDIADQPNSFETTSTANFFYFQGALGYDTQIAGGHKLGAKLFVDQQTANYQFDLPAIHTNFAATGNYAFQDKYFAELAVNYSGFNRFQPGSKYGTFFAAGIGWDLAKESFLSQSAGWLDQLKLRATYGKTGNTNEGALGYYSWRSSYGQDGGNGYSFGSEYSYVNSLVERGLANVNGTWEKGSKFNIGLDASFWNSKFRLTADYYRDRYYDLLQQRGSTIELIGIDYPNENIGENLYEGQELSLTYQNHAGAFNYFVTANASRMRTQVLYMNEVFQQYDWNRRTGMPIGQTFGYLADGLIQNEQQAAQAPLLGGNVVHPGDVKLVDLNDDGIINMYDQTAIGNTKPTIFYGATLGFNVSGFDFSVLLQGVANRTYQKTDYSFGSNGESQGFSYLVGRWTPETAESASYPRLTVGSDPTNTPFLNTSSYWTRSGEYLRVRNLELGYTVPFQLSRRINIAGLRIFANAQNLFTFTPYSRLDPEINNETSYPAQRTIVLGVNIKL
ncbi:SusC/RagA family TonB-linked outer membrane protein [Sphingobacterium sp. JB170]|uniref:SusC/RagA family TonB-linked outer membrane protein n=1 Tax=Sphingobacterium sp. JB170 TaxID=1434842 RepID=UPI00097EB31D|nr:SusC/RagA family TonB-linked outer membrane protein [Sphingobacterium sp. JB170]SJN47087.1 putative outer membrane protein, probably involved in nutrient binding [Sphingobacterium sp. JB170]